MTKHQYIQMGSRRESFDFFKSVSQIQSTLDDMQSARTITLALKLFELFPLELYPSQKTCPLYNLKTVEHSFTKLYMNINQQLTTCKVQEP